MQVGGLGSGHSVGDHHVTKCIHDHHETQAETGGMSMKASSSGGAAAVQTEIQADGLSALSAWMKNMLGNSRGLLLNFWKGGEALSGTKEQAAAGSLPGGAAGSIAEGRAAVPGTLQEDAQAAAAIPVAAQTRTRRQEEHNRSYLSAGETPGKRKHAFWQKRKPRNSFQTKQEKPREDLRRHSRYRKDTLEISCAFTEDSFLMDSYDRKGEYSRLTTKK